MSYIAIRDDEAEPVEICVPWDKRQVDLEDVSQDAGEQGLEVDEEVTQKLPQGTRVLAIMKHGRSNWTRTARLSTESPDGSRKDYFLKVAMGERGRSMMRGEFESMKTIFGVSPTLCPRPIAWGSCKSIQDAHFFLCDFHEMKNEKPDPNEFGAQLAQLHKKGLSPNGKFGFHIVTHNGNLPLCNDWTDTWEEFYDQGLRHVLSMEERVQGHSKQLKVLAEQVFDKVIPRLLRPLETGGRDITPALVHGDLWHGNCSIDADSGRPIIYDAGSCYAHNEYELGDWRPARCAFDEMDFKAYHAHYPKAQPEGDADDRNRLYSIRFNLHASFLFPEEQDYRRYAIEDMEYLVAKFPDGFEGFVG